MDKKVKTCYISTVPRTHEHAGEQAMSKRTEAEQTKPGPEPDEAHDEPWPDSDTLAPCPDCGSDNVEMTEAGPKCNDCSVTCAATL